MEARRSFVIVRRLHGCMSPHGPRQPNQGSAMPPGGPPSRWACGQWPCGREGGGGTDTGQAAAFTQCSGKRMSGSGSSPCRREKAAGRAGCGASAPTPSPLLLLPPVKALLRAPHPFVPTLSTFLCPLCVHPAASTRPLLLPPRFAVAAAHCRRPLLPTRIRVVFDPCSMRQLWPGAAETGVTASSSSTSAARAPGFFLSLAILLWAFLSILAEAVQPGAGGPRSIDPDHIEFVSEHETGPPSRNPKALATVVPRDGDLVVRSEKPRSTGISGGLVPHTIGQRSLKDFEVEDWVLVATVDGGLTARERKTGIPLWNFTLEEPVVRTVYHRANMSAHERDGTDHATWIVGPSENGELYQFTYEHGLEVRLSCA